MRLLLLSFALAASLSAAVVNYSYDAAGRLVKIDYGATGGSITYTYDKAGNLLSRTVVSATAAASATEKKQSPAASPAKAVPKTSPRKRGTTIKPE